MAFWARRGFGFGLMVFVTLLAAAIAQPAAAREATKKAAAAAGPAKTATTAELIAHYGFAPHQIGFAVRDLQTGRWLSAHNAQEPFLPASVSKVPTTVAALELLGPSYRWETRLVSTGSVVDGVLKGDLYLVGGGDPVLDGRRLSALVDSLGTAGIRAVDGRFLYDDTLIASAPEIEPSQPADLAYNPGFGALALDFNRVMLTWDPKGGPRMGEVFDVPPVDSVRFRVSGPQDPPWSTKAGALRYEDTPPPVVTAGLAPMAHPPQTPGESWVLAPTWKGSGSTWLPVKHPGAHVAQVARALAQRDGVTLPPPQPGAAPPRARVIGLSESPPLFEVATAALKHSNNLVAEMIGMTATRRITGRALAPTESAETLAALFRATLPGLDWSTFRLANHSGLTMDSRMTPEQMTAILDYAQLHAFSGLDYAGLLPTRRWGLEDDSDLPETRDGRLPVWAKTGTVYYGRGLAGYIVPRSGHLLAFSFFANDLDKRRTFDEANLHHDGRAIAAARGWLGRARALERDLVERWLATY